MPMAYFTATNHNKAHWIACLKGRDTSMFAGQVRNNCAMLQWNT